MDLVISLLTYALGFVALLLATVSYYMNNNFAYWRKRGVPYDAPELFFGNVREFARLRKSMAEVVTALYDKFEGQRFAGIFMTRTPVLLLRDPELIKQVLVKDFPYFHDRGNMYDLKKDPLSAHLFSIKGSKWRMLRTKLTPTFTSGKMKMMFQLMDECSSQLLTYLKDVVKCEEPVEMREILAKFATDVIGTCAFGLQLNSLSDSESDFRKMGKKALSPSLGNDIRRLLDVFLPDVAKHFTVRLASAETTAFFVQAVKDSLEYREKNNITRKDFIQLLIQMRKGNIEQEYDELINNNYFNAQTKNGITKETDTGIKNGLKNGVTQNGFSSLNSSSIQTGNGNQHLSGDNQLELTDELLAAQAFVFFLAGFETSATSMSFTLHELAVNPDIQDKLRDEVDATLEKCGGRFTYDAIQEMEYLDKVLSESLRKYPPGHLVVRQCTRNYAVPDSSLVLEKGIRAFIPVYALHHDPKYYPEPDRFDPERFSPEEKAKRPPFTYLPFGEGPRICIGMRFGILQAKVGLAALISRYEFRVCERTQVPLTIEPRTIIICAKGGVWLRVVPRPET